MRTDRYRKLIYEEFAKRARAEGLEWIVLHGIEGYPESIGRDLDSYCVDGDTITKACELFEKVAMGKEDTLYVIYPNPLWGKRVLAISQNYEVAELHVLYRINTGIVSYTPDWSKMEYLYDFPYEKGAMEFKSIVMSLLGNNIKTINRMEVEGLSHYNPTLKSAYYNLKERGKISKKDKICIYLKYCTSPVQVVKSLRYSLKVKAERKNCGTVPIICFKNYSEDAFLELKDRIFEVFTDFECADDKNVDWMVLHTARQEFVYTTGRLVENAVEIDLSDVDMAARRIVEAFRNYNIKNRNAVFEP